MKTILMLAVALLTLLLTNGCSQDFTSSKSDKNTFESIKDSKILRVGYIVFPPIVTKDVNSGELGGHFISTIKEIARQAEWHVEFVETDWTGFSAGLNSKRFDISIAPTFTTIPRLKSVAFTDPLLYAGNSAIVRANDARFSRVSDFNSKNITIAVTQGEAGHEYALSNLPNAKLIVHPGSDQLLTFQDVLTGRADVALGDAYVTAKFASNHEGKVKDLFSDNPYNLTPVSWAIRYGDEDLLSFLNNSISLLSIQGKLRQYEKESGANWLHAKTVWTLE